MTYWGWGALLLSTVGVITGWACYESKDHRELLALTYTRHRASKWRWMWWMAPLMITGLAGYFPYVCLAIAFVIAMELRRMVMMRWSLNRLRYLTLRDLEEGP